MTTELWVYSVSSYTIGNSGEAGTFLLFVTPQTFTPLAVLLVLLYCSYIKDDSD